MASHPVCHFEDRALGGDLGPISRYVRKLSSCKPQPKLLSPQTLHRTAKPAELFPEWALQESPLFSLTIPQAEVYNLLLETHLRIGIS